MILSGNLVGGVSGHSLAMDTHQFEFPAEISLLANSINVNLLNIAEQLGKLKICISEWLDHQPNIKRGKGKTMVFAMSAIKSPATTV